VPIGLYRIGSLILGTLPGEFTTLLGRDIANHMQARAGTSERVLLIGLANEYLSYFTTREEHAAQQYEGASMLWGPFSGELVKQALGYLAENSAAQADRTDARSYLYQPGLRAHFDTRTFSPLSDDRLQAAYTALANVLMSGSGGLPVPDYPFVVWIEPDPAWPKDPAAEARLTPQVCVVREAGAGWAPLRIEDRLACDSGLDFVTWAVASLAGETRWASTWMAPPGVDPDLPLHFMVQGTGGRTFYSRRFTVAGVKKDFGFVDLMR
jgi:hypothetical protein